MKRSYGMWYYLSMEIQGRRQTYVLLLPSFVSNSLDILRSYVNSSFKPLRKASLAGSGSVPMAGNPASIAMLSPLVLC